MTTGDEFFAWCKVCGRQFDPFAEGDGARCDACVDAPEACATCEREPTRDLETGEWRLPGCNECR